MMILFTLAALAVLAAALPGLKPHQIEALRRGESTYAGDRHWAPKDLPEILAAQEVQTSAQTGNADAAEVVRLRSELDTAKVDLLLANGEYGELLTARNALSAEYEALRSQVATGTLDRSAEEKRLHDLIAILVPADARSLDRAFNAEQLKAIATARGVAFAPEISKAQLVNLLAPTP